MLSGEPFISKTSIDLLDCHTQLLRRFRLADWLWPPSTRFLMRRDERSSSVNAYGFVSRLLERSGETRPSPELLQCLQSWKCAFLGAMAIVSRPTRMASDRKEDLDGTRILGENVDLSDFKELVADGNLTGAEILDLIVFNQITVPDADLHTESTDWLLILLTELIKLGVIPIPPSLFDRITAMFQRICDAQRAGLHHNKLHVSESVKRQEQQSATRLKLMGALEIQAFLSTSTREGFDSASIHVPSGLARGIATYINSVCEDDEDYVDILCPGAPGKDPSRDTFDHITTLRVIGLLAELHPEDIVGSGLIASTDRLIARLDMSSNDLLQDAVEGARTTLTRVVMAPSGVEEFWAFVDAEEVWLGAIST